MDLDALKELDTNDSGGDKEDKNNEDGTDGVPTTGINPNDTTDLGSDNPQMDMMKTQIALTGTLVNLTQQLLDTMNTLNNSLQPKEAAAEIPPVDQDNGNSDNSDEEEAKFLDTFAVYKQNLDKRLAKFAV